MARATSTVGATSPRVGLSVAGLFAGIAGIERGLTRAGHHTELLCEIDAPAQAVLRRRYPEVPLVADVRDIRRLPRVDLVTAGFPCQDLSQAGRTAGIAGSRSGLVGEVFRLVEGRRAAPDWLLLENVPFMLRLDRGAAMHYLTETLGRMGFMWAYRVIDARAFGLPQRRKRVVMLASRKHDPRGVLFFGDDKPRVPEVNGETAFGFYWTEGLRGLGWGVSCVPTLKGGSTIGIPSPPAIWMPDGNIVTPDIRDAERLQGFPVNWTDPALDVPRERSGVRWKLVGNAVSVPMAEWVGERLGDPRSYHSVEDVRLEAGAPWPSSAWGRGDDAYVAHLSSWPVKRKYRDLHQFLRYPPKPLSARAAAGFLNRARRSNLRFVDGFLEDVQRHAFDTAPFGS